MLVSLKENAAFRRLYQRGKSVGSRYLVIYCRPNRLGFNRLGLTVSTKLGHAVVRNRIRRRLREIYRQNEQSLKQGFDLVIVARTACVEAPFSALSASFSSLADKLELKRGET